MRVLRFEKEQNGCAYTLFAQAARHGEARGIEENRRVTKLLDKLDGIGTSHVERLRSPSGEILEMTVWELTDETATIVLDDALYDELWRRMEGVPWNASASPMVVEAYDFLEAAPTELDANGVNPERRVEEDAEDHG